MASLLCITTMLSSVSSHAETADITLETTVVTATREAKPQSEVPESVSILTGDEIKFVSPAHPAEVLNRTAGVHVNNLGGEGHMTAIRQPITTGGVYLFLEDGIPTRPTGLFNHNALYEINIPQADKIEIIKGPGSALYGSDSIGGIINSITKPSPRKAELEINPEYGSYGWKRLLASGGSPINNDFGFRIDLNLTDNEGYRDESEYNRYSTTGRLDGFIGDDLYVKTILSYTQVDQSGVSGLEEADYLNNPKKNFYHNDVGRREVEAFRFSSEISYEPDSINLYTITPFFRDNQMKLMPSWMLTYDPNDRDYQFQSYGFLAKYRRKLPSINAEFITGVDVDYTPSTYQEVRLSTTQDSNGIFTDTSETGRVNYDYDADQLSISPYVHGEWQAQEKLRLTTGLRYDYFTVDYQDNLPSSVPEQQFGFGGFNHLRPDSGDLSYDSFSPKLGIIYDLTKHHDLYANYRHSFRVPSIGQLFRSGSSTNTSELDPVKTDSFEIGSRGQWFGWLNYDAAIYHMVVKDDIVRYIDTISNTRQVTNAGETEHQGIEIGLNGDITDEWGFRTAWSFTNQEYKDYTALFGFPTTQINYAGNDVGKAPSTVGNLAIQYRPSYLAGTTFELEWEHLGEYYTDETNTQEYGGHDLFNVRASYDVNDTVQIYGRAMNITDELYSTYTSNQVGDPDIQYRPGLPRAFYVGLRATF
ncbi:MAG: TonB-dependent receptor [Rickettsiales bacterium]|nr:TonB-dependent receptor [Rickettsiales bacterium]